MEQNHSRMRRGRGTTSKNLSKLEIVRALRQFKPDLPVSEDFFVDTFDLPVALQGVGAPITFK